MSVQPIAIGPELRNRLERLCRGLGAHRVTGAGPGGPSPGRVALPQRLTSEWRRVWTFPSRGSAENWNREWEQVLLSPGRLHPALLSLEGRPIPDATLDVVARIAATILGQDVQTGVPTPGVKVGWRYELLVSHAYQSSPSSWSRDSLAVILVGSLFDAQGALRWSSEARRDYSLAELPPGTPLVLTRRPWVATLETYRAA
jgi:hypothetical protein